MLVRTRPHIAAALVLAALLPSLSTVARADAPLDADDRQALRRFEMNRLFAMLGYLQQQAVGGQFDWEAVGYAEVANAAAGLSATAQAYRPPVRKLVEEHESRHKRGVFGAAAVAALGGWRGLAAVELDHAAIDVSAIQKLLIDKPPTQAEWDDLASLEKQLVARFQPQIPGLRPDRGGFLRGGRYLADKFSDAGNIPFFTKRFSARRLFLPPEDRQTKMKEAWDDGYLTARGLGNAGIAEAVREGYKKFRDDEDLKWMFREGFKSGRAADKALDTEKVKRQVLGDLYGAP